MDLGKDLGVQNPDQIKTRSFGPNNITSFSINYTRVSQVSEPKKSIKCSALKVQQSIPETIEKGNSSTSSTSTKGCCYLPDAQIARRRELGLCFCCDKKLGAHYQCKKEQLQIFILTEEENDDGKGEDKHGIEIQTVNDRYQKVGVKKGILG